MCRIAAYVGPPITLSSVLYDPPHGLDHQAYAPRELVHGHVNVDGTGIAWWNEGETEPLRYVTESTPWADANLPLLAPRIRSGALIAAVRSATPGIPFGSANVAPFVSGPLAGTHNGHIGGFGGALGQDLVSALSADRFAELGVLNDSRVIFLTIASQVEAGTSVRDAMLETIGSVRSACHRHDARATLNVVVGDGHDIVAVRTSYEAPVNSLYTAVVGDGAFVTSEALDDQHTWIAVPEHALVETNGPEIKITPLKDLT